MSDRTIRVAGVQALSADGEAAANLAGAAKHVGQAAERGAQLVLCPEFLAAGYRYHASIWQSGEPIGGATEAWLCGLAKTHGIHVGATYLEASGSDFYNTFALAEPGGAICGRVRKESLPAFEGWYFRPSDGPKFIDTALGRLGVGICQDNHTARFARHMQAAAVDLLLMPHSAPCAVSLPSVARATQSSLHTVAEHYAEAFGIPTLMVNKACGPDSRSPMPLFPFFSLRFRFPGLSRICAAGGQVLDRLSSGEGIVLADVHLDPSQKRRLAQKPTGYWFNPPKELPRLGGALFQTLELIARPAYGISLQRRRVARRLSQS